MTSSGDSDCYFFVCKLISALTAAVFSILSFIYGIIALAANGPIQTQNATSPIMPVVVIVLSATGVIGLVLFIAMLLILETIPIIIKYVLHCSCRRPQIFPIQINPSQLTS